MSGNLLVILPYTTLEEKKSSDNHEGSRASPELWKVVMQIVFMSL